MSQLKLYRVMPVEKATFEEFAEAVVYAYDAEDAVRVVRETYASRERFELPGAWGDLPPDRELTAREISQTRGAVLGHTTWG